MTEVLVLAGGLSPERDVSLRSGRRVAEALRAQGLQVTQSDVDAGLLASLAEHRPGCVVPLLHGAAGEDGALRDVLESMGIPFVGSPAESCRLAFDKPVAKTLMVRAGVAVPAGVALPHAAFRELGAALVLDAVLQRLPLPIMVKPAKGGSSLGAAIVRDRAELPSAMVGAFAYCDVVVMEQLIEGVEVGVGVIDAGSGPIALPPVEIVPASGFYDYSSRYTAGTTEFFTPARLDPKVLSACAQVALTAHRVLGLTDWSRSDLMVDASGTPHFLEVNVAPGMTETSLLPQALAAADLEVGATVASLVASAVARGSR